MCRLTGVTRSHRILIIAIFLLIMTCLLPGSLYAGGSQEKLKVVEEEYRSNDDVDESIIGVFNPEENSMLSRDLIAMAVYKLGSALDRTTESICISLSPYPHAIEVFYPDLYESTAISKWDDYAVETEDVFMSSVSEDKTAKGFGGKVISKDPESQKRTTRMLMIIIGSLFLVDMLFSIIYTYITGGEDPVLKTILVKFVMAILIGALIMALPFLVEALRFGFGRAVQIMVSGTSDPELEYCYEQASNTPIFHYPGLYMKLTTVTLSKLDPEELGVLDMFGDSGNVINAINKGLCSLLFIIMRVIILAIALISALHILWNIIELYLLTSIGLIMLPWQLFNPLSFIGKGVFRCLVSNIIQLTVITFIMLGVMPITFYISNNLWQNTIVSDSEEFSFVITNMDEDREQMEKSLWSNPAKKLLGLEDICKGVKLNVKGRQTAIYSENFFGRIGMVANVIYNNKTSNPRVSCNISWYMMEGCDPDLYSAFINKTDLIKQIEEHIPEVIQEGYYGKYKEMNTSRHKDYPDDFADCKTTVKKSVLKGGVLSSGLISSTFGLTYEAGTSDFPEGAWTATFIYFAVALLMSIMPNYFVTRSSQIANGLMDGRDSGPDFSGLMQNRLLGKAAAAGMHVATAPARMAAKGTAAGLRAGVANEAEKMSQGGHSVMGAVMKGLSGSGQSAREFAAGVNRNRDSLESTTPSQSSGDPTGTNNQTKNQ